MPTIHTITIIAVLYLILLLFATGAVDPRTFTNIFRACKEAVFGKPLGWNAYLMNPFSPKPSRWSGAMPKVFVKGKHAVKVLKY